MSIHIAFVKEETWKETMHRIRVVFGGKMMYCVVVAGYMIREIVHHFITSLSSPSPFPPPQLHFNHTLDLRFHKAGNLPFPRSRATGNALFFF